MPKHKANSGSPGLLRCRGPVHHMVAVVFAAIKVYIVQLHCDVSVGVKHPRMYASGVDKKREKMRRLYIAVVQSLLVTTTAGQDGGTNSGGPVPCGPVVDPTPDNPTDRALPVIGTLPSELRSAILHDGPRRRKVLFAISSTNGNRRMFSNTHYHAYYGAVDIERQWFCFSPTMTNPSR